MQGIYELKALYHNLIKSANYKSNLLTKKHY